MHAYTCVHAHMEGILMSHTFFYWSPSCFLRQGLSLNLELICWLGSKAPPVPTCLQWDYMYKLPGSLLHVGAEDLNSGPYPYTVSTLSTEPFLRPQSVRS